MLNSYTKDKCIKMILNQEFPSKIIIILISTNVCWFQWHVLVAKGNHEESIIMKISYMGQFQGKYSMSENQ